MNTPSIIIDGREITYTLKTSARRRTVGMRVDANGLNVSIPSRMARGDLPSILLRHASWITRKLQQQARKQVEAPQQDWRDGASLRYLGQDIRLCLLQEAKHHHAEFDGVRLYLAVAEPQDSNAVQRKVVKWFRQQALTDFSRRIELLAARLGASTPPLYLSNASTRWGSCNSKGEIRLHWRLIQAPPHIIGYVVAHELSHLKEMNHSPQFWKWVEKLCPDYRAARKELKEMSGQLHLV